MRAKLKSVGNLNPFKAISDFLQVRPVGLNNKEIIKADLEQFQETLARINEKEYEKIPVELTRQECELLLDYLSRYMQHVGETDNVNLTSGSMLKLYERIVKEQGVGIILASGLRNDGLTNRINNY